MLCNDIEDKRIAEPNNWQEQELIFSSDHDLKAIASIKIIVQYIMMYLQLLSEIE